MAELLLRGTELGAIDAVLFDKDGTLSISEPQLLTLAEAGVFSVWSWSAPSGVSRSRICCNGPMACVPIPSVPRGSRRWLAAITT